MTDLASPVVQVVTARPDWPAIVAAISGGIVGLAGISFAWLQTRKTISAEDARVKLAEKRRIYANCIAALITVRGTLLDLDKDADREVINRTRLAVSEVDLIADKPVAGDAHYVMDRLLQLAVSGPGADMSIVIDTERALEKLTDLMRQDLGVRDGPKRLYGTLGPLSSES